MIKTFALALGVLLGSCLVALAQHKQPRHAETVKLSQQQIDAGGFAVTEVGGGEINRSISVPGSIVPSGDRIARVAVRLLGTVVELRKRLGDSVQSGEVVAIIESREVADAKSEYLAARLVIDLQRTLFERSTRLFEGKVLSENDFLRARTAFEDARIKIETARQKLFALSLTAEQIEALPQQPVETLRRQELRSPIAGRVAERRVEIGSLVGREGQESELYVIVDSSVVWADLAVPTSELAQIHEAKPIAIATSAKGILMPGAIMFISPLLDKDTRAARVVASVENLSGALRPGAFVTAQISVDKNTVPLFAPLTALQTINGKPVVFVRNGEGFEARAVDLGRQDARSAEIIGGLVRGEAIATMNTFILKADLGKSEIEHDD